MATTNKARSTAPRLLRVHVAGLVSASRLSCVASLPVKLAVVTKLRGHGTANVEHVTPAVANASSIAWDHEIYEFDLTEAEMYTRVLECVLVETDCLGWRIVLGSAKIPLASLEMDRGHVHSKEVAFDALESDLRLRLHVDVWDVAQDAAAVEFEAFEHQRCVRGEWSQRHLRPSDRPVYRCGPQTDNVLATIVPPTPDGCVPSLGWAADESGWFYATSFAGPWHNSNASYPVRRRRLVHRYRPVEVPASVNNNNDLVVGQSVAMPDMSIQASLAKRQVMTEDY
ncbi:hypothetical protein SPRG_12049 [Saprolegnia parasitica CBS 223.65]|uniref:Peroxin/Ferlin domain-containing protein n=1 Tax=Saprolegnia parasitica (strain CBS 223.65) TaxID=695850 RepID=A0A067C5H7_SAPPC|nr:hypothetical protein SPRG_12049 [Saprolegnia parasitica CBS 223.65]KDO22062.1 hypothetical protein SPRG_12049 [Saprolegnia parasitica CBS 223.65]|eukprot:XP_012207206.1 hypothetical protein SPRG_12049 [Saprolegnia parasitica CBS 223.65]